MDEKPVQWLVLESVVHIFTFGLRVSTFGHPETLTLAINAYCTDIDSGSTYQHVENRVIHSRRSLIAKDQRT